MDALTSFCKQVEAADADLLREMITTFAGTLMSAEADALCGAGYGERSPERVNSRNGYRERTWDTRTGTIDPAIPKLRSGSYFPDWLLEQHRRSDRAWWRWWPSAMSAAPPPAGWRAWSEPWASSG
jgi:transposase-like protein